MSTPTNFHLYSDDDVLKLYRHRKERNDKLVKMGWTNEHLFFRNDVKLLDEVLEEMITRGINYINAKKSTMTPQEQLIQAKAKDLTPEQAKKHLARIDDPIYKNTNDLYFGLMERDFGNDEEGDIDFIKGILTSFAAQIEATTREEDAKICEAEVEKAGSYYDVESALNEVTDLIRSKITKT